MKQKPMVANVESTYVHLDDASGARLVEVDERFWPDLMAGKRPDLEHGRTVMGFSFAEPWSTWEMHPLGDEVVVLLQGATTFTLERDGGPQKVSLDTPGQFVVIPRGVWHTADARTPTSMLFITAGSGTQHRPRTTP
jgi:mannose-6-phosphate isomerase-like protein (cupin superfamily)